MQYGDSTNKATELKNTSLWERISITKISAAIAVVSTIVGITYQKGMISKMNLGNMEGNFDVREIIFSSIQAYISFFGRLAKSIPESFIDKDYYVISSALAIALIGIYFLVMYNTVVKSVVN